MNPRIRSALATQWPRREVDEVTLYLPLPISVNRLWANRKGGRRRCSDAYAAWKAEAGARIMMKRPGRVAGGFDADLVISTAWGGDADNGLKCVLDALQAHGVIDNDGLVRRITIERGDAIEGCAVTVRRVGP